MDAQNNINQVAEDVERRLLNEGRRREFDRFIEWKMEVPMEVVFSANRTGDYADTRVRLFSVETINDNFYADDLVMEVLRVGEELQYEIQEFYEFNGNNFGQIVFWNNPDFIINGQNSAYLVKLVLIVEAFFETDITTDFVICIQNIE